MYVAKYVDDMTIIDTIDNTVRTDIDSTPNRPLHTVLSTSTQKKTQEAFRVICDNAGTTLEAVPG